MAMESDVVVFMTMVRDVVAYMAMEYDDGTTCMCPRCEGVAFMHFTHKFGVFVSVICDELLMCFICVIPDMAESVKINKC